jgi:hypothetical protein
MAGRLIAPPPSMIPAPLGANRRLKLED